MRRIRPAKRRPEKNLSGAARTSFVTKCEKDASAAATKSCKENATAKKLSGAARTSYVTKCEKDTLEATDSCVAQAADKKLAGAARTSFTKKCVSDAAHVANLQLRDKCPQLAAIAIDISVKMSAAR